MNKIAETVLRFERETKNKVRYDAEIENPAVSSIYISKSVLGKPYPELVTITVAVTEEV